MQQKKPKKINATTQTTKNNGSKNVQVQVERDSTLEAYKRINKSFLADIGRLKSDKNLFTEFLQNNPAIKTAFEDFKSTKAELKFEKDLKEFEEQANADEAQTE